MCVEKVGQSLDRLGGGSVRCGLKPGSKAALGRLAGEGERAGKQGFHQITPDLTLPLPNTELPPITLSVTKTLVCTEPGQSWPQYSCLVKNIKSATQKGKKNINLWWIISFDCVITAIEVSGG